MPDWRDDYLTSLQEAERNSAVNKDLVDACSQLADRVAVLEAEKAVLLQRQQQTAQALQEPQPGTFTSAFRAATRSPWQQSDNRSGTPPPPLPASSSSSASAATGGDITGGGGGGGGDAAAQTRLQLAEALRSRGQLQTKLRAAEDELRKLRSSTQVAAKQIHDLKTERNSLQSKLRDRNEELDAKTKAFLDVQDENLALNLEIASQDKRMAAVKAENKQLIERWMKRVGEEADAMNLANEPSGIPRTEGCNATED
ncbi:autophagy-related protein 16 [Microdochium trichocladiopsis]|uniref:Autophagy-related protein 16 n=1 Tax=Microdochium trichocladiopsis TaxID=1682393 RepID=A0A9P8YER5_9PEZI|nr:autophagy-related protein 16 [Microdochium trichocladiopsis]KAH7037656.1 autophagy-related protein 16 [Microdochium trichocladiopsis]